MNRANEMAFPADVEKHTMNQVNEYADTMLGRGRINEVYPIHCQRTLANFEGLFETILT